MNSRLNHIQGLETATLSSTYAHLKDQTEPVAEITLYTRLQVSRHLFKTHIIQHEAPSTHHVILIWVHRLNTLSTEMMKIGKSFKVVVQGCSLTFLASYPTEWDYITTRGYFSLMKLEEIGIAPMRLRPCAEEIWDMLLFYANKIINFLLCLKFTISVFNNKYSCRCPFNL